MAHEMDADETMPFKPFRIDTRIVNDPINTNPKMQFLSTMLAGLNMNKYGQWLKEVTYQQLLEINNIYWQAIEGDIRPDEGDKPEPKPMQGGKLKLAKIIDQMNQRKEMLLQYQGEVENSTVMKLNEILIYLLRISNFPMDTATDDNIAGHICKILEKVLEILEKNLNRRVGFFFTIFGIILDVICSLNWEPFETKCISLNSMVRRLKLIANNTGNMKYIQGQGINEDEMTEDRKARFKYVKYLYLAQKGKSQTKQAQANKKDMLGILRSYELVMPKQLRNVSVDRDPSVDPDPSDAFYAEHDRQSVAVLSGAVGPPSKHRKLSSDFDQGSREKMQVGKEINILMGIFYGKVLKNKVSLHVLLEHRKYIPQAQLKTFDELINLKKPKIRPPKTSFIEYYRLPRNVTYKTVRDDINLKYMINTLEAEGVDSVGVDTESSVIYKTLELVQIATKQECFLIRRKHVKTLSENLIKILGDVLSSKLIIFFAGSNDSDQLQKFIPNCKLNNMLDIQKLVNALNFKVLGYNGQNKPQVSLSDCVEEWLGNPLNKDLTMSDWGTSDELSHDQSVYAVLDAWVLIPILEAVKNDSRYERTIDNAIARSKYLTKSPDSI